MLWVMMRAALPVMTVCFPNKGWVFVGVLGRLSFPGAFSIS